MNNILSYLIFTFFIIVIGFSMYCVHLGQEDNVKQWAESKGTVESIVQHYTTIGTPFYISPKGGTIFEVKIQLPDSTIETWFVRQNGFFTDYEQLKD